MREQGEKETQIFRTLVTGQNDGKSDKNLSVGNLVAESQQNYGSLDRGLMRRSRFVIDFLLLCKGYSNSKHHFILFRSDLGMESR